MSALAGLWRLGGRPDAEADCRRMLQAQSLYGPHASGAAVGDSGAFALGRNLYRLLQEDAFDRQPIIGARWLVAGDLRLDDRDPLSEALGLRSASLSDADLLAAALERWGEEVCPRLYGEFTFAAFDQRSRRLLLARCHAGLRPLVYHQAAGLFAFASMPKGLHALAEIPRAPDEAAIALAMVAHAYADGRGVFEGVRRLEPGTLMIVSADGRAEVRHWWSPAPGPLRLKRPADYVEAARAELDAAVRRTLRGQRNVAAHLSSGFDSSGVAATAARLLAPAGGRVTAFTAAPRAGYDRPLPKGLIGDETQLAALAAAMHPNMEHVVVRPGARSYLPQLDRYVGLNDQPALNLSNQVWLDAIQDQVQARGLTVLLTGEAGNLGLSHDGFDLLPQLLAGGRLWALAGAWRSAKRAGYLRYRASAARTLGPYLPGWLWGLVSRAYSGQGVRPTDFSAIRPDLARALEPAARKIRPDLDYRPLKQSFARRLWALTVTDRGAGRKGVLAGWGIDQRDPTSDRRLLEFCLQIPAALFLRHGVPRAFARDVLADRLPAELLGQRARGRQAVDWHEGVEADLSLLRDEIARIGSNGPAARIIDVERLAGMADHWPGDGFDRHEIIQGYRLALLRGVSFGHFLREASGG